MMKKYKENQFFDKFRFLYSQESSEEIIWSCSDSSDHENSFKRETLNNNIVSRKRKRRNNRNKDQKNTSNLDISIVDSSAERKSSVANEKSPALRKNLTSDVRPKSPILTPSHNSTTKDTNHKPINKPSLTSCNNFFVSTEKNNTVKSPVISIKSESAKVSPEVRKKLFAPIRHDTNEDNLQNTMRTSPILSKKNNTLDRRKTSNDKYKPAQNNMRILTEMNQQSVDDCKNKSNERNKNMNSYNCKLTNTLNTHSEYDGISVETKESSRSDENVAKKSRTQLIAKVKSYFDNCFNSQASSISISECETVTPKDSPISSCEIETSSPRTQEKHIENLLKLTSNNSSIENNLSPSKIRKVKFKKGGLSYRLEELIKKQNISVSLWQNERFLAANSNFIIPKQKYLVFRIQNVSFKYGLYLLKVLNTDNESFLVIINSVYIYDSSFQINSVLKIYEPFKIFDLGTDCKTITNICKYECEKMGD